VSANSQSVQQFVIENNDLARTANQTKIGMAFAATDCARHARDTMFESPVDCG
jgi:hypothetical protein